MVNIRTLMSLIVFSLVFSVGFTAEAKTPDGETPAVETCCDPLSGAQFGICNAFCEAQDCDELFPDMTNSCDQLLSNWENKSDAVGPPCVCEDICAENEGICHDECITRGDCTEAGRACLAECNDQGCRDQCEVDRDLCFEIPDDRAIACEEDGDACKAICRADEGECDEGCSVDRRACRASCSAGDQGCLDACDAAGRGCQDACEDGKLGCFDQCSVERTECNACNCNTEKQECSDTCCEQIGIGGFFPGVGCVDPSTICDDPGTCSTFTQCSADSCGGGGVCAETTEGGPTGLCTDGATSCAGLADCSTVPCAEGSTCLVDTCCGNPVCVTEDNLCPPPAQANGFLQFNLQPDGPTIGGLE